MGGGGGAPKPDKNIGKAAMLTAQIGQDYLDWTKQRAETTDAWSAQDRSRYQRTFLPLQNSFIKEAKAWDSPGRQQVAANAASADVWQQAEAAQGASERNLEAMGVNPRSGRYVGTRRALGMETALAAAGARNLARDRVRAQGLQLEGQAINLGSGMAVNPLSSFSAGSQGVASGVNAAQQGLAQQGSMLNSQYENQLKAWDANQQSQGGLFGALGTAAAFMPWSTILSSKEAKTDKKPANGFLKTVRALPVESWRYEPDAAGGDGGAVPHVGTYAEDFTKATGTGDGRTINVADHLGVNLGAVKELDKSVTSLGKKVARIERSLKAAA